MNSTYSRQAGRSDAIWLLAGLAALMVVVACTVALGAASLGDLLGRPLAAWRGRLLAAVPAALLCVAWLSGVRVDCAGGTCGAVP